MELGLEIYGDEMQAAQLEVLIKILAHQRAIASMLCDKFTSSDKESDQLYRSFLDDSNDYGSVIHKDLFERRGHVDPKDILPNA